MLYILLYFFYILYLFKYLYKVAAKAPPASGANINTQTCLSASPPRNIAGARLLAGFTEVPVKGIPIKCTNTKVNPITIPATLA